MGVIKQIKKFLTGESVYPVTKSNAVYDDTLGRVDLLLAKSVQMNSSTTNLSTDGNAVNLVNPTTSEPIMPVTNTDAVFDNNFGRLDQYLAKLVTGGTTDLVDGQSALATGTLYVKYKE